VAITKTRNAIQTLQRVPVISLSSHRAILFEQRKISHLA
jgi:hypothetical protein